MLKTVTIFILILTSLNGTAQSFENRIDRPKEKPDTLYFAYKDDVQLIIINNYDTYRRYGEWYDAMYPRSGSWFMDNGPKPENVYIFRNKEGEITKVYNSNSTNGYGLKSTNYVNADIVSLYTIQDYRELNNHLMIYGVDNKVGLINLKGDVVVPAIYNGIRKYQDSNGKRDKLIIENDGMFGFLDSNLNVIFQPIYHTGNDKNYMGYPEHNILNEQYIKVFKNEKCGIINENGDILIDFQFDDFRLIHDTMYVGINYRAEISENKYFWHRVKSCIIYDKYFNQIAELKDYEQIEYFGIKRFIVKKNNKYGVLNHKGEVVVPLEYDSLTPQNGDYYVSKNNKSGIINLKGEVVLPIEFERNIYFYGQAIYVTQDGLIGVYNDKYKLIAKPQFVRKTWDMGKYILTRKDGTEGFVMHQKEEYYQSPEGEIIKL